MQVNQRAKVVMRRYLRHHRASALFAQLADIKADAIEVVIAILRLCEKEGLTPPGFLEGVTTEPSYGGQIRAHGLLGDLPKGNKLEAMAIVAVFPGYCDEAGLSPAVVHARRELEPVVH